MLVLYLQSADAPVGLVICLLLLAFHEAHACEVPKFVTTFVLVSLCLLGGWNLHTCCIFPFACEHFLDQRTSCSGLVTFVPHSCSALALAWPRASASCTFHWTGQCTGVSSSGFA